MAAPLCCWPATWCMHQYHHSMVQGSLCNAAVLAAVMFVYIVHVTEPCISINKKPLFSVLQRLPVCAARVWTAPHSPTTASCVLGVLGVVKLTAGGHKCSTYWVLLLLASGRGAAMIAAVEARMAVWTQAVVKCVQVHVPELGSLANVLMWCVDRQLGCVDPQLHPQMCGWAQ